jgi:hypothetical protein
MFGWFRAARILASQSNRDPFRILGERLGMLPQSFAGA